MYFIVMKMVLNERKLILAVLFIVLIAHASYIFNDFSWLDHRDIEAGRSIVRLEHFLGAFLTNFADTSFYRPVVTIVNSIDKILYGSLAWGFHLTNIILHTAVSYSSFLFTKKYFKVSRKTALLASLIFGVHTLSWLPAGAISYRSELLASLFTLLTISFHIKAKTSTKFRLHTLIFLFLALASKETTLFWTFALIVFWEITNKKIKSVGLWVREAFVFLFHIILRFIALPDVWHISGTKLSLGYVISSRAWVLGKQLIYLISPFKPPLSDAVALTSFVNINSVVVLLFFLAITFIVLKLGLKSVWSQVLLFIGITLLPSLNIIPLPRFTSPHYSYFASVGIGLIGSLIYEYVSREKTLINRLILACLITWVFLSTLSTFVGGFHYKNDLTLFGPEVENDKNFKEGLFYLGDYYLKRGDFEKAEGYYARALDVTEDVIAYVDKNALRTNLAMVKLAKGELGEAEELLNKVYDSVPKKERANVSYNLALISFQKKDYKKVIGFLEPYKNMWSVPEPLFLLSKAYIGENEPRKAAESLRIALTMLSDTQKKETERIIMELER